MSDSPLDMLQKLAGGEVPQKEQTTSPEKIKEAALILETIATPGGQALLAMLDQMGTEYRIAPEDAIRQDATSNSLLVDTTLVAVRAGARECLNEINRRFKRFEKIIKKAAKSSEETPAP